jgi:predicted peptidase
MFAMNAVEYQYRIEGNVLNQSFAQTATTSVTTVSPTNPITAYSIQNNSGSVAIQISDDGGSNYRTVVQLQNLVVHTKDTAVNLKIKTSSGTAGYDLEYTTKP